MIRHRRLNRGIGFKMNKLLLIFLLLVGCDCVNYDREHALTEPSLNPFFRLGFCYNSGTHDLDIGRIVCSFTCEKSSVDIILKEYLVDGWQLIRRGKKSLLLKKGFLTVRIEVGDKINVLVQREF